jgi:hypothetical protein
VSAVRAWISFVATSDEPEPWDGILLTSRGDNIEAMYVLSDNKKIVQLLPDGQLRVLDEVEGVMKPSTDMAALGRAIYVAMTGREPPP